MSKKSIFKDSISLEELFEFMEWIRQNMDLEFDADDGWIWYSSYEHEKFTSRELYHYYNTYIKNK